MKPRQTPNHLMLGLVRHCYYYIDIALLFLVLLSCVEHVGNCRVMSARNPVSSSLSPGPYSRPAALAKLDGRTKEARLIREVREQMVSHVGGSPSAAQMALIDRAAWLSLYLAQIDAKTATGRMMTEHDSRQYLATSNALTRLMRQLGLKGAAEQPPSLAQHLARHAAGAAA